MLPDLEALTPPIIMCLAFIIGVIWLLRTQMAPKRRSDATSESGQAGNSAGPGEHDRRA